MSDVLESTIRKHGQIKYGKNILLVWADLAKAVAVSISFIKCLKVPLNKSPTFSSFLWEEVPSKTLSENVQPCPLFENMGSDQSSGF